MGRRHQTTLVTVTYPVINYILLTVADTFCLSDISPVIILNQSSCFVWFLALDFIPTLNKRLTSLNPTTNQHHENNVKGLSHYVMAFCQQIDVHKYKKAIRDKTYLTWTAHSNS